jgi:hypothetical protein
MAANSSITCGSSRLFGRGGAVHQQVVVHQEEQQTPALAFDLQAAADGGGQRGAFIAVRLLVRRTAGIMQQQRKVEDVRLLQIMKQLLVQLRRP